MTKRPSRERAEDDPETQSRWRTRAEHTDEALARLMRRARESRERRRDRIVAQKGEPLWRTMGRVLYLVVVVLVDGIVLLEVARALDYTLLGWAAYALALAVAVPLQVTLYKRWFDVPLPA